MDTYVNSCKNKYFTNGVHIKILTICFNSLVSIGTFNSDNLIGYAQSAGNQTYIISSRLLRDYTLDTVYKKYIRWRYSPLKQRL
jgi:hypothetical protein